MHLAVRTGLGIFGEDEEESDNTFLAEVEEESVECPDKGQKQSTVTANGAATSTPSKCNT